MKLLFPIGASLSVLVAGLAGHGLAAQDRDVLKVPDGLAFSEFKGYEAWAPVAVSQTPDSLKVISANAEMIKAYRSGLPADGKAFPEGSRAVKIEWARKPNPVSPYEVQVPGALKTVALMVKDSKRFPKTHGWAWAIFRADPATGELKPDGTGVECGYACHTRVATKDYVFTAYPGR